jgi:hypothetical protein
MSHSIFSEVGIAGAGFLLLIAGIILTRIGDMLEWAKFCISLGISFLFVIAASKLKGIMRIMVSVICVGFFVAAIIFFANAV